MRSISRLEFDELSFRLKNKKILDKFSGAYQAGRLLHFKVDNQSEAALIASGFASFFRPETGKIIFDNVEVFANLDWYRSRLLRFNFSDDLFERLTVRDNLRLYAEFFDIESTVDKDLLGPVDQNQAVCYLSQLQRCRLKFSIYCLSARSLLFYANPFYQLNADERRVMLDLFKKNCADDALIITVGSTGISGAKRIA
ncbi:MAG: hypothetical protein ACQEP7_04140 [bacterium]